MSELTREIIIDALQNVLGTKVVEASKVKRDIQFNCTVHGESNPSAGFSVEKGVFNCFSCHASGNLAWLLFKSLDSDFSSLEEVNTFLKEKYNLNSSNINFEERGIKRFDELKVVEDKQRIEFPMSTIAPFKSGKETYKYFYDRGFNKDTVKLFMIGRDLKSKTVTIPIFWENKKLAGVLGRYIDPNRKKNQRYKIYEFLISNLLYPLDKLEVKDGTIILVEGTFDAMYMHELGYTNTLATLGNTLSTAQAEIINGKCKKVIIMYDNDQGGVLASEITKKKLRKDILIYSVKYPRNKNDVCDCSKGEIESMLFNKKSKFILKVKRL